MAKASKRVLSVVLFFIMVCSWKFSCKCFGFKFSFCKVTDSVRKDVGKYVVDWVGYVAKLGRKGCFVTFLPFVCNIYLFFLYFCPVMKYGNCIFFLLFPLWCLPLCLVGQTEYGVLDLRDGLAESRVRSIAEMPDGRLAIATAGAISIYDGTRFHVCELLAEQAYALPPEPCM